LNAGWLTEQPFGKSCSEPVKLLRMRRCKSNDD
jgi:hypothetical protein